MGFSKVLPVWWSFYWRLIVVSVIIEFLISFALAFGYAVAGKTGPQYIYSLIALVVNMATCYWAVCSVFKLDIDEAVSVWWAVYWRVSLVSALLAGLIVFIAAYLAPLPWGELNEAILLHPFEFGLMTGWVVTIFTSYWGVHAALKKLEPEKAEFNATTI